MPYKLRKAPNRDLYWVVAQDGTKKSKEPIPLERAKAQIRALYASMSGGAEEEMGQREKPVRLPPRGLFEPLPIRRVKKKPVKRKIYEITGFPNIPFGRHEPRARGRVGGAEEEPLTYRPTSIYDPNYYSTQSRAHLPIPFGPRNRVKRPAFQEPPAEEERPRPFRSASRLKTAFAPKLSRRSFGEGKGKNSCKPPYHDYSKGKASAFVLGCIDPRYAYDVAYFLQHKKELHQDYDLFTLPGASLGADQKDWKKTFFDVLELGLKLHGIKEVWCFDHLDCGMYKAVFGLETDMNPKIHIECMDKLKKEIKKKHPELKFRKFMVDAKGHISSV